MGELLGWLDQYELAEDTIVIFFSDNGGGGGSGLRVRSNLCRTSVLLAQSKSSEVVFTAAG